ncbi:MAG: hypothetical protein SGCHY_000989 [Lobulomycetales sp.]
MESVQVDAKSRAIFVAGSVGIGKTAFLFEAEKYSIARRAFWVQVNSQDSEGVPYFTIKRLLDKLAWLLSELDADTKERLRNSLTDNLGGIGKLLTNLVPSLVNLIGNQPKLPEIGPHQAQERFYVSLRKFFAGLSCLQKPIILVIDDFDAMDIESVKLLRQLMDSEVKGVLFIMAHLDSNSETSQLSKLKRHVQNNTDLELDEIYLQPLMKEHIAAIIGNVVNLEAHDDNVAALSEFIFKRSNGGIPLLVHEIIKNLQQRNLFNLEFTSTNENDMGGSFDDFQWRWNPEAVRPVSN